MKKWRHTLLISTLVLGAMPYSAINPSIQANAVEVETQEVPSIQAEETTESKAEVAPVVPNETEHMAIDSTELEQVTKATETLSEAQEVESKQVEEARVLEVPEQETKKVMPRRTDEFTVNVDGTVLSGQKTYYHTNTSNISFKRTISDEFAYAYAYSITYNDSPQLAVTDGNTVNLSAYTKEGIYKVSMRGITSDGDTDTGFFYNNVQRTASSVDIDGIINTPGTIVENPSSITVGKDANDQYGTPHYT